MKVWGHSGSAHAYKPYGSWGWRDTGKATGKVKARRMGRGLIATGRLTHGKCSAMDGSDQEPEGVGAEGRGCQIGYCQDTGDRTGGMRTGVNRPGYNMY